MEIKSITTDDEKEETMAYLKKEFFKDEILNKAIKLFEGDNLTNVDLEGLCNYVLSNNLSLKAVAPSGEIIGAQLNGKL